MLDCKKNLSQGLFKSFEFSRQKAKKKKKKRRSQYACAEIGSVSNICSNAENFPAKRFRKIRCSNTHASVFFLKKFILLNKLDIYTLIVLLYFVINKSMKWSVFYCLHTINNKCQCCKSHFISYKLIELIRKVSKKIFRTHTKTFGGKIWVNLHSVSPGNILGKNLNRCCVKFPAKTYLTISRAKKFSLA